MRTRQFGAAAAAAAALVLATSGCSPDTVGTPTEPAPYGTPVRLTIDSVEVDYTVTWEVVVTGIAEAPYETYGYDMIEANEHYPDASCWYITATWTQIDGPPAGTELPFGPQPDVEGIYPDGSEALHYADGACNFFPADALRDSAYISVASVDSAPGNGQTTRVFFTVPSIVADPPTAARISPTGRGAQPQSYVKVQADN